MQDLLHVYVILYPVESWVNSVKYRELVKDLNKKLHASGIQIQYKCIIVWIHADYNFCSRH